jgi:hypothetical protein
VRQIQKIQTLSDAETARNSGLREANTTTIERNQPALGASR